MSTSSKTEIYERLMPVLLFASVALAFVVGILWHKVNLLGKGDGASEESGSVAGQQVPSENNGNQAPNRGVQDLSVEALKGYAEELGINKDNFASCLDGGRKEQDVKNELQEGTNLGVTGTPAFFMNGRLITGALPFNTFKAMFDFELKGGDWNNPDESVAHLVDGDPRNGELAKEVKQVNLGDAPSKGDGNAPITLVEFSDFECSYCSSFASQTLVQIEDEYIDTGKVRVFYKQFPLTFHANAQKASEAALCAKEEGKFWEYHDRLFRKI